jgi:hypothetical protein
LIFRHFGRSLRRPPDVLDHRIIDHEPNAAQRVALADGDPTMDDELAAGSVNAARIARKQRKSVSKNFREQIRISVALLPQGVATNAVRFCKWLAIKMGRPTGLEPATPRFTILCSNQLSYDRRN